MSSFNLFKIILSFVFVAGVLLVAAGITFTPDFVAHHFSSDGILAKPTIQAIQFLRISAYSVGALAIVLAACFIVPSRVNRYFNFTSRLKTIFSFVAGVLLVVAGITFTPEFVAHHFSSNGHLLKSTIQAIQFLRISAYCFGALAIVLAANFIVPSRVNRYFNFISGPFISRIGERLEKRRYYLPFCFACFGIALIFGLLLTQSGTGLSFDSIEYIKVGENLYYGNGLLDAWGAPFNHYPLYPVLIAGCMHLGFGAEDAGRIIPILSFALLMFPLFFLGKTINGVFTGYVVCLLCLVFTPLLWLASYAWPDMLAILLIALAILFLAKYAQSSEGRTSILFLSASGVFTALAICARFSSVVLLATGLLVVLVKYFRVGVHKNDDSVGPASKKSSVKNVLYHALLFTSISILPLVPWLYRNYTSTGKLTAGFLSHQTEPFKAILDVLNWFIVSIPEDLLGLSRTQVLNRQPALSGLGRYFGAVAVACLFILLVVFVTKYLRRKKVLWKWLGRNYVMISFILIYLSMLIATFALFDSGYYPSHYLIPVYPFILILMASFPLYVYRHAKKTSLRPTYAFFVIVLLVSIFALQTSSSISFYQYAKQGQGYNNPSWRNDPGIAWIAENVPEDAKLYSDRAEAFILIRKKGAYYPPHIAEVDTLNTFFEGLKTEENSYLIDYKGTKHKGNRVTNDEIAELNREYDLLEVVADFPESTIWRVK
jgi:hypothetical protein